MPTDDSPTNPLPIRPTQAEFQRLAERHPHATHIPIAVQLFDDQLTPVTAYRRLVAPDQRTAHSFLFESVEGGTNQSRFSILGSNPSTHVVAHANTTTITHPDNPPRTTNDDPYTVLEQLNAEDHARTTRTVLPPRDRLAHIPDAFSAGWVGFTAYDTVRYAEPHKVPFTTAPEDDRNLPDLHFAFYNGAVIFDHATKRITVTQLASTRDPSSYNAAADTIRRTVERLREHAEPTTTAPYIEHPVHRDPATGLPRNTTSNTTKAQFLHAVERAKEYIRAGDIFQVVIGQRLEQTSTADPFDVYRALRAINPSPYMAYLQAEGCILIASSPEILCRVHTNPNNERVLTNRPLAGTRPRGTDTDQDNQLEAALRADPKETAEHVMLVDLARNDVGKVANPASVSIDAALQVERYSHVMHLSSTVTGTLPADLSPWQAISATLPVGTVSGAPKVRAMQIIDELERHKRGPYAGGIGYVTPDGDTDIALALRTIVCPISLHDPDANTWTYHLQAAAGIVFDSEPESEHTETVNKAAALTAAINLAEHAFSQR